MDDAERILSEAIESQALSRTVADPDAVARVVGMIRRQRDAQASDLVRSEIRRERARTHALRTTVAAGAGDADSCPAQAA